MFDGFKKKITGGSKEKEAAPEDHKEQDQQCEEPKKKSMMDKISDQYNKTVSSVKENEYVKKATTAVETQVKKADNFVTGAIRERKQKMEMWMKRQVEKKLIEFILKFKPKVAQSLKDPDMPEFVKSAVDVMVDESYPMIVDEVKYQFRMNMYKPKMTIKEPEISCCCLPCHKIKTWYNYSTNPVDMSVWARMKTFSYWLLASISFIPFYGIQQALYLFAFLCMDKGDEFQLVSYILDYKKAQFIGQGVIAAFTLYLSQFSCMRMWDDNSERNPIYDCVYGVADSPVIDFYLDLVDFASQLLLIWFAFILLPCSESKGKASFDDIDEMERKEEEKKQKKLEMQNMKKNKQVIQEEEEKEDDDLERSVQKLEKEEQQKMLQKEQEEKQKSCCDCSKGGKLYIFMLYDFLAFGVACAAFYYSYSTRVPKEFHQTSVQFAIAKLVYGGLSLPFLIFKIGQLQTILTKARPTAYDRYGNTVPASKIQVDYEQRDDSDRLALDMDVDMEKLTNEENDNKTTSNTDH